MSKICEMTFRLNIFCFVKNVVNKIHASMFFQNIFSWTVEIRKHKIEFEVHRKITELKKIKFQSDRYDPTVMGLYLL